MEMAVEIVLMEMMIPLMVGVMTMKDGLDYPSRREVPL